MGDEDHRYALVAQPAQQIQERVNLPGREDRSRLIQEEYPRTAQECLDDFDALPLAKAQVANFGLRADIESELGQQRLQPLFDPAQAQDEAGVTAERNVLQDGKIRHQCEVLVDRADATQERIHWGGDLDFLASYADGPSVWLVHSGKDVHQRRLASAIFAQHRMDLTGPEVQ